jgi:hypothetical protein
VASYECVVAVAFTATDGRTYVVSSVTVTASVPLAVGAMVALRYDPNKPTSIVQEPSPRLLGAGLIGGGVLLGGVAIGLAVLTFKSKGFAAVSGTAGLLGAVRL